MLFLWIGRFSGLVQIFAAIALAWSLVQAHWADAGMAAAVFAAGFVVGHLMRLITGWDVQ